jgi:ATP-dependent DNA helicase RecQ
MISFFESNSCISRKLSEYFGEILEKENCGHCSFCKSGKAVLEKSLELESLEKISFNEISREFNNAIGDQFSLLNLTKFLCGISVPVFSKLKIKKLNAFGIFEQYPFRDVKNWISEHETGEVRIDI